MKCISVILLLSLLIFANEARYKSNKAKNYKSDSHLAYLKEYFAAGRTRIFKCGKAQIILNYGRVPAASKSLQSRWPTTHLTYRIWNYPAHLNPNRVIEEISKAFSVWAKVSALTFRRVATGKADINVEFVKQVDGDHVPSAGQGGTLLDALLPIEGAAVHFDLGTVWTINQPCQNCVDLFQFAAHEFGHVLGLHHSIFKDAIMWKFFKYKSKFTIHKDDIRKIQALYGPPLKRHNFMK